MKISYIVCTRNRAASLTPTFESIALQPNAELVIVDNGSTDNTAEVLSGWARTARISTVLAFEPVAGLARARNAGLRHASGEIVAFTDDDCRVAPDHGESVIAAHTSGKPSIIGGKVTLGNPDDAPITVKLDDEPETLTDMNFVCGFLHGCNMTMPRQLIDAVGTFDERFGAGAPFVSAEDTDYCYRAAKLGFPVLYDPSLVVAHYHGRQDAAEVLKLQFGYSVGKGAMALKHRDLAFVKPVLWDVRWRLINKLRGRPFEDFPNRFPLRSNLAASALGTWRAIINPKGTTG